MGRVFKYGNNIDTDVIMPGKYLVVREAVELAKYCMRGCDETFASTVKGGDVIVAGDNFGCGSSREHAPISIKASGIVCVIANSFARIFFRNAINIGLLVIECKEAVEKIKDHDQVEVDFISGVIKNISRQEVYFFSPYPKEIMRILQAGGIKELMKRNSGDRRKNEKHK